MSKSDAPDGGPNSLEKFRQLINETKDDEMLEVAEGLMEELAAINNLKQKIEMMEENLHKGKRAAFYFFTLSLDSDGIAMAAQNVRGRRRVLREKAERLAKEEAANSASESETEESISEE